MGLFGKLFKRKPRKQPEEYYDIIIEDEFIRVEHPKREVEQLNWNDVCEIVIITTDEGPFHPDVWLVLIGDDQGCSIPLGAPNFDGVYDIVSKYEGFNYERWIEAMGCAENARFVIWKRGG